MGGIVKTDSEEYEEVINSDDTVWTGIKWECDACERDDGMWNLILRDKSYGYCANCGELIAED